MRQSIPQMSTFVGLFWFFYKMSLLPFIYSKHVGQHVSAEHINTRRPACPSPNTLPKPSLQTIIHLSPEAGGECLISPCQPESTREQGERKEGLSHSSPRLSLPASSLQTEVTLTVPPCLPQPNPSFPEPTPAGPSFQGHPLGTEEVAGSLGFVWLWSSRQPLPIPEATSLDVVAGRAVPLDSSSPDPKLGIPPFPHCPFPETEASP